MRSRGAGRKVKAEGVLGQSLGVWLSDVRAGAGQLAGRQSLISILLSPLRSPAPPKDHATVPLTQD